jgi:hypothetical protein
VHIAQLHFLLCVVANKKALSSYAFVGIAAFILDFTASAARKCP